MKYLNPHHVMPNGRKAAQVRTVEACENAVASLRKSIRTIEAQLQSGAPKAIKDGGTVEEWERKARFALAAKRDLVDEITGALELVREERVRQLVQMRLDRQEHARKLVRIEKSRYETEGDFHAFKQAVKALLGDAEYAAIWSKLRAGSVS